MLVRKASQGKVTHVEGSARVLLVGQHKLRQEAGRAHSTAVPCCWSRGMRREGVPGEATATQRAFRHAAQELDFIPYARGREIGISSRRQTWSDLCLRKVNLAAVSKVDWRVKKPGGGKTRRRLSKVSELGCELVSSGSKSSILVILPRGLPVHLSGL